ncbi:putative ribonuclease H-like domain-containing protein [Tanacetum coccineum]
MNVKKCCPYMGKKEEEYSVCQPPGFEDPHFPNKVYKVEKALYGLHQAPRAWYETLSTYLLDNGFHKGQIDKTLFIRRHKDDILLVQFYMENFLSFWDLSSKQKSDGIFISQDKYVSEILKKFDLASIKTASTPMEINKPLTKDEEAENVDGTSLDRTIHNRSGSIFLARDRFQAIDSYEKKLIQVIKIHTDKNVADLLTKAFDVSSLVVPLRKVGDEAVHKELGDRMERAATTASSSEAEQDSGSGPRCQDTILGDVDAQTRLILVIQLNAAKHKVSTAVNVARHQLLLLVQVPAAEGDSINTSIKGFTYFFIRFHSFKHSLNISPNSISSLIIKIIIMSSPKFAETHNVVVFLEKPAESDGFAEIIDFLKASSVSYALTVNPIIYTSCIQQFWATAQVKMVNGVRQLQALIDKKKVIITEASIRNDLHLDDAEALVPSPQPGMNSVTQWIICLATNQKFNLSKYIFDAMVKHLDGGVKFLLYPRFLQVFINQQLGNMSTHKKIFVNPFHTKKVFANMKRAGKDFSGRITPLFDTMMVQPVEEMGDDPDHPTDSTPLHIIDQPYSSSQSKKKQPSKKAQRQEAEVPQDEAEHEESVPTPSNDPQPSGKDSMQLTDLMVLCTKLQTQVLDLQKAKDAQAKEIAALKKRIQRLERRKMSRPTGLKRLRKVGMSRRVESSKDQESLGAPEDASKQGRSIEDIDADVDVSLVDETQERQNDDLMFDSGVLEDDVMHVEAKVDGKDEQSKKPDDSTAGEAVTTASVDDSVVPTTIEEITLAQTLIQIKAAKPKVVTTAATTTTTTRPKDRGVVVQEPSEFRVPQETQPSSSKDKGKGIMIEPEVPLKRKDQIALDEQIARDIQAKLDAELLEEQKLARKQEEEANIALIESWENTQAMMEADRLLAERLQSKEREELTDEEKAKLFMELMEKRRKHFAALRAQEKRNRPPTKAQKRTQMSTYLKHMGGYTYKQLKGKSFDEIQKLFDKEMKRVNTFVAMGSEVQESKEKKEEGREETAKGSRKKMLGRKRAGKEQQKESSKKQKVEEEKESEEVDEAELKKLLVIKKDKDIAIDAIPLATKLPVIIDYKLLKEGMMIHYQLIRADGSSKRYSLMLRINTRNR